MNTLKAATLAVAALGLAACSSSPESRALEGGAIGAAAGAGGAAILGTSVVSGALVGGAVGAATGALTDEDDIDLD